MLSFSQCAYLGMHEEHDEPHICTMMIQCSAVKGLQLSCDIPSLSSLQSALSTPCLPPTLIKQNWGSESPIVITF